MYQVLQRMLAISTGERYHDAAAAAEAMRSVAQIPYEALSHGGRVLEHQPVLRDYRVRSTLGRGRSVWLAEKMSGLGGLVAVRVGRPGASRAALLREIESFTGRDTKIRSVHVVEIRDLDTAVDGVLVLISEYVDGDSLESVLARQRGSGLPWHPPPAALARGNGAPEPCELSAALLIMDVLEGLKVLHSEGPPLVHRGITPSNIIYRKTKKEGRSIVAVLTDIRLPSLTSSLSGASSEELRRFSEGPGRYMSPELARLARQGVVRLDGLDARADVWAAGVVLYEALSGKQLFPQVVCLLIGESKGCHT